MRERQKAFVEGVREYEEMRKDEENEKKKGGLVIVGEKKKMKRWEHT